MAGVAKSVRAAAEFWARVDAAAGAEGVTFSAFVLKAIERAMGGGGDSAPAPAPTPAPRPRPPMAAVDLKAKAEAEAAGVVKVASPKVDAARAAMAQAEAGARHLAKPKPAGERVSMRDAMERAGIADYGSVEIVPGSRLKGAKTTLRRGPSVRR